MYRTQKKIPTLLALFLLLSGLTAATFLTQNYQSLNSLASTPAVPEDIHVSNVTESSFSVSYITATDVVGSIEVSTNTQKFIFLDDLDTDNTPRPRKTHMITAKKLTEQTAYTIKINGTENTCKQERFCPIISQITAPKLSTPLTLPPMHGSVLKDSKGAPAVSALIYAQVGKNALLASRVDSSGLWVIPLSNLHTNDLSSHALVNDDDLVQITVKLTSDAIATAVVDIKSIKQNYPVPAITIGNTYNYVNLSSKKDLFARDLNQRILGVYSSVSPTITPSLSRPSNVFVSFPKQDFDTTPDTRPRIRGTGKPNTQILITVQSNPQIAKITIGKDGSWTFRPPKELIPGVHQLSITSYDDFGNVLTLKRSFVVLKSGEQVLGDSTPSASITPTDAPSATPTIEPTNTPLPTPLNTLTPAPPTPTNNPTLPPPPTSIVNPTSLPQPKTGNVEPVFYILGGGSVLLFIGTILMFL